MWEVVLAVLLPTIAPGLALLRILDASADTFRKALLCFPIGLLTMYGTSGLLFVIQAWSVTNLTIALVLLNALSIAFLTLILANTGLDSRKLIHPISRL